jgi:cytochrome c oxidase subunit 2
MRTKLDKPKFEYLVYCNKICGGSHYNMKKIVRVVTEAEYQAWIAQQKPYSDRCFKKGIAICRAEPKKKSQPNRLALNN